MTSFTLPTTCIDVRARKYRRPETSVPPPLTSIDVVSLFTNVQGRRSPKTDVQRRHFPQHRRPATSFECAPTSSDVAPSNLRRPVTSWLRNTDVEPYKTLSAAVLFSVTTRSCVFLDLPRCCSRSSRWFAVEARLSAAFSRWWRRGLLRDFRGGSRWWRRGVLLDFRGGSRWWRRDFRGGSRWWRRDVS